MGGSSFAPLPSVPSGQLALKADLIDGTVPVAQLPPASASAAGTMSAAHFSAVAAFGMETYTVDYTDAAFLVASTAASKTLVTLASSAVKLLGVSIRPQTAFAGTAITAITGSLGSATGGNEEIFLSVTDLMQTTSSGSQGGLVSAQDLGDSNLAVVLHATATGANFGNGAVTNLTAGKLWVTVLTYTLSAGS
jgi:hypothetical protein